MEPLRSAEPQVRASGEWQKLRKNLRRQAVDLLSVIAIFVQDAVILVAGFLAEFAYEKWLHNPHPFVLFAINISSGVFLLLYVVTVTVHVLRYVRGQFAPGPIGRLGRQFLARLAQTTAVARLSSVDRHVEADIQRMAQGFLNTSADPTQLREAVRSAIRRAADVAEDCTLGRVRLPADDWPVRIVLEEARAGENIRVISWASSAWWRRKAGQDQLAATKNAVSRGASVTRVFVLHACSKREDLDETITTMKGDAVRVYEVADEDLPTDLRSPAVGYIIGQRWAQLTTFDAAFMPTWQTFTTRASEVDEASQVFQKVLNLAKRG